MGMSSRRARWADGSWRLAPKYQGGPGPAQDDTQLCGLWAFIYPTPETCMVPVPSSYLSEVRTCKASRSPALSSQEGEGSAPRTGALCPRLTLARLSRPMLTPWYYWSVGGWWHLRQ